MFTVLAILRNLHVDVADDRILIFKIIARNVTNAKSVEEFHRDDDYNSDLSMGSVE